MLICKSVSTGFAYSGLLRTFIQTSDLPYIPESTRSKQNLLQFKSDLDVFQFKTFHTPLQPVLPVVITMLGTFPKAFPQAATSQGYFPKWQLLNCENSQAGTFQVCSEHSARPPPLQSSLLGLRTYPLGSCHLENCHLENVLRKMHLGKHLYCNPSFSSLIPSHPLHFLLVSHHPFFHIYLNFFRYSSTPSPYTFSFFTLHFILSLLSCLFWLLTSSGSPLLPFSLLLPDKPSTNEEHSLV